MKGKSSRQSPHHPYTAMAIDNRESAVDNRPYRDRLSGYSDAELEDVYYNIDILKNARRYRALVREMETRKLLPVEKDTPATKRTALDWIESRPFLERHLI